MLKVQSLIEKEIELEESVEDNKEACRQLVCFLEDLTKKKSIDISGLLFNHG